MFKQASSANEIAFAMEQSLAGIDAVAQTAEEQEQFSKAIELLNNASELFEQIGLVKEAEATTRLLEVVAAKKKKDKSKPKTKSKSKTKARKKTDKAVKGLTSEKMIDNLKEKGWVFNADDLELNENHEDDCDCSYCIDMSYADDQNDQDMMELWKDDEVEMPWYKR